MEPGDKLGDRLPAIDTTDPGQLEAMYANFGFGEPWRKVVLANCKEIVRAKYAVGKSRISEARIDDLAHLHDSYLQFLTDGLKYRTIRENNLKEAGIGA